MWIVRISGPLAKVWFSFLHCRMDSFRFKTILRWKKKDFRLTLEGKNMEIQTPLEGVCTYFWNMPLVISCFWFVVMYFNSTWLRDSCKSIQIRITKNTWELTTRPKYLLPGGEQNAVRNEIWQCAAYESYTVESLLT